MNKNTIKKTKEIYSSKLNNFEKLNKDNNLKSKHFFEKIMDKLENGTH